MTETAWLAKPKTFIIYRKRLPTPVLDDQSTDGTVIFLCSKPRQ